MKISKRGQALTSSPLYIFAKKVKEQEALGRKIISLGLGEPYNDTPEKIKQAAIEAINENKTHYNPSTGSMQLRTAIAKKYGVEAGCVSVSSGAKPFLATVLMALLDEGDVVFLADPYYPPFAEIVKSCGAEIATVATKDTAFQLTFEALKKSAEAYLAGGKGLHIIINSPNNPTGVFYDKHELEKIVFWCVENNITVISDECYNNFSADPSFTLRNFSDQVIVINSFSKTYAMTGWRVGWVVCSEELNVIIGRFLDSYIGCPCSVSDAAALAALETDPLADFSEQREMINEWLEKNGIASAKSTGGIFVFPDFSSVMQKLGIGNSTDLALYFLEKAGVATTPGISFGSEFDAHLRLTYCIQKEVLQEALEKLEDAIKS